MGVQVTVLGSGSAGNCTLIESASTRLLVDAGLSALQIRHRLATLGRHLDQIDAILLTHEHSDHSRALGVLSRTRSVPVFANRLTAESVADDATGNGGGRVAWRLFATGQSFAVGDFQIDSFSVPHDAYDPVGYVVRHTTSGIGVGVLTDLGHATKLVQDRVRATDFLIVEANHDVRMLQADTARPWATKQRILSRHGHLSNEAAAELTGTVASDRLRHVFLAHLSRDCNRPDLADRVVRERLGKIGARHVQLTVASQDAPTATVAL